MTDELEDPRKTELRQRTEEAADAAGYVVDLDRPFTPFPDTTGLKGAFRPDVFATGTDGVRLFIFVRVEGDKPLPAWLVNYVRASVAIDNTEVFVVVEDVGDQLRGTCESAGAGLLVLRDNTLERVLDYGPPDDSTAKRAFAKRARAIRKRLDAKLRLNKANLDESFQQSFAVTAAMKKADRDEYLVAIETVMVAWDTWGEDMAERLDAAAANGEIADLDAIDAEITRFDAGDAKAA